MLSLFRRSSTTAAVAIETWHSPNVHRRKDMNVPDSILAGPSIQEHVEALRKIDRITKKNGTFSHTTERFRFELLYFLLDNKSRGPIVEVGTYNGGLTALFAYVGAVTGRRVYGVDIEPIRVKATIETCAAFGLDRHMTMHQGTLHDFAMPDRPDLVFIDSDHSYEVTYGELEILHKRPPRCVVLHDFNYRQHHQTREPAAGRVIAVDQAVVDFFADKEAPIMKRLGAFSGDGTVSTPDQRGGIGPEGDYIKHYGTEGMMLLYS